MIYVSKSSIIHINPHLLKCWSCDFIFYLFLPGKQIQYLDGRFPRNGQRLINLSFQSKVHFIPNYILNFMSANIPNFTSEQLGQYALTSTYISCGGYGLVRQVASQTGEAFIIKKIAPDDDEDKAYSGMLPHPRIVIPLDSWMSSDGKHKIMLFQRWDMDLEDYGNLYPKQLAKKIDKIFVQLLEGLRFLHQSKIYHNDIKSSNILIKRKPFYAALADFSLAGINGQPKNYSLDIFQILYTVWQAYGGQKFVSNYVYCSQNEIQNNHLTKLPPVGLFMGLCLQTFRLNFSQYPTADELYQQAVSLRRAKNVKKAKKGRKIMKELKLCNKCQRKVLKKNFVRHYDACPK